MHPMCLQVLLQALDTTQLELISLHKVSIYGSNIKIIKALPMYLGLAL